MPNIPKTRENVILFVMWFCSLSTYSIALLNNYKLFLSDYFGLTGLFAATLVSILRPKLLFICLILLLTFGLFDIVSFVYFLNFIIGFGQPSGEQLNIQLFSLLLLAPLILPALFKSNKLLKSWFGKSKEDKERAQEGMKEYFKDKFRKLTDKEIESRLANNLDNDARQALMELKTEREAQTTEANSARPE